MIYTFTVLCSTAKYQKCDKIHADQSSSGNFAALSDSSVMVKKSQGLFDLQKGRGEEALQITQISIRSGFPYMAYGRGV